MSAALRADPAEAFMTALSQDWRRALVEIDRELVRQGGLRAFVEIAWHLVEREGTFEGNWHIDQICDELEAISRGENRRLAIAMPPRHMKSLLAAVFWPAWDWIGTPGRRFLFTSYAYDLALRDSEKSRRIMESDWYRDRWGDRWDFVGAQNRKERYANSKGGERITSSVDSKLTGEGGDIIVVDDPHNVREAESEGQRTTVLNWWRESLSSRHNDPRTGVFVLIQQRVHYQDLMGYVLENDTAIPWRVLCLPAEYDPEHKYLNPKDPRLVAGELLWPVRFTPDALAALKKSLGVYAASAQLQQTPTPRDGGFFKRQWFTVTTSIPADIQKLSRAWDLAASIKTQVKQDPDYTSTVKIGYSPSRKKYIIMEVERWRVGAGEVRALIKARAERDGYAVQQTVPQDPGQAGKDQAQQILLSLAGWPVKAEPPTGDKGTRASSLAGQAEVGNVEILADGVIEGLPPWHTMYLDEMCGFPFWAHDDMLDASASAFNRIFTRSAGILDYYAGQLSESERRQQEDLERRAALGAGMVVVETHSTDAGQALGPGRAP